jgi:hypothetical protein
MISSQRHLFLAYSTYTSDAQTYNDWYDQVHIPQVLSAPGRSSRSRPSS